VTAPGPRGWPLLGDVVPLARDPIGFVERVARTYGPYASFRIGPMRYLLTSDPAGVRHVLVDAAFNYLKGPGYDGARLAIPKSSILLEGEAWKQRRRFVQPDFAPGRFLRYPRDVADAVDAMHERWDATPDGLVDLRAEMTLLTLDVIGRTVLGGSFGALAGPVVEALGTVLRFGNDYGNEVVHLPLWFPTRGRREFPRALARLREAVRERGHDGGDHLAARLRQAERDGTLPPDEVVDELVLMMAAGHETSATALTYAFALLGASPEWSARVAAEPDAPDAPRPAADAVFAEAVRLYPPLWFLERTAVEADEIGGYAVPAGGLVAVSPWVVHRDPERWPDPLRFDPGRFFERPAPDAGSYLPFSAGPRVCTGIRLAQLEARLVLGRTLARYELLPVDPGVPRPVAELVLRPAGGFRVRFRRRRP
jgi:cytochrome P450